MYIAWALSNSPHRSIAGFWYLIGSIALLVTTFDLLQDTPFEALFLGLTTLIVYISTANRSRILLFVGTLSMLAYISHITYAHLNHTLGWPLVLMICGIAFISVSAIAMKINNRYIRKTI